MRRRARADDGIGLVDGGRCSVVKVVVMAVEVDGESGGYDTDYISWIEVALSL